MRVYETNATAFSFVGSTKRVLRWTQSWQEWPFLLGWFAISLLLLAAWFLVLGWYCCIVFLFWIVIPWRVVRRQHRQARRDAAAQREYLRRIAEERSSY